jgi:hypothetical protein
VKSEKEFTLQDKNKINNSIERNLFIIPEQDTPSDGDLSKSNTLQKEEVN